MTGQMVIDDGDITIGGRIYPISDIVAITSTISGIVVTFRDGSMDLGDGGVADFYTLRDRCPWATASI